METTKASVKSLEIERKLLVLRDLWDCLEKPEGMMIGQGYVAQGASCVVRIRVQDQMGYLALKGPDIDGVHPEYEYPISREQAVEMLDLFTTSRIRKTRYVVPYGGRTWEVDEFHEPIQGFVLAEVELPSRDVPVERPLWTGLEVTGWPNFQNASLLRRPDAILKLIQEWEALEHVVILTLADAEALAEDEARLDALLELGVREHERILRDFKVCLARRGLRRMSDGQEGDGTDGGS